MNKTTIFLLGLVALATAQNSCISYTGAVDPTMSNAQASPLQELYCVQGVVSSNGVSSYVYGSLDYSNAGVIAALAGANANVDSCIEGIDIQGTLWDWIYLCEGTNCNLWTFPQCCNDYSLSDFDCLEDQVCDGLDYCKDPEVPQDTTAGLEDPDVEPVEDSIDDGALMTKASLMALAGAIVIMQI